MKINPINKIKGIITVPGDKSISHRSIMIGSISKGKTVIKGFLLGEDCLSTISCFREMGIKIDISNDLVVVHGQGLNGLTPSKKVLDVGNSGTTIRLMSGILSGQSFESSITGDNSIQKRPMDRIITPLTMMNANIKSLKGNGYAPIIIKPSNLHSIDYTSPVASAQVKSCILFANLYTDEVTTIKEPYLSRNHTEIMLNYFGANIETNESTITSHPVKELYSNEIIIPSDISSAAYFIVAALITPNSEILIKNVGINPTRDGIIEVLKNMNANIELDNIRFFNGEKVADIIVKHSKLIGTTIEKQLIPRLIDEIPVIAVAAAFAEGTTIIKDASELKVKESNRIDTMVKELKKMNVNIIPTDDGMIINGGNIVKGANLESYDDHRVAMSLSIAALQADSPTLINNSSCINISYPNFFEDINSLTI